MLNVGDSMVGSRVIMEVSAVERNIEAGRVICGKILI